MDTCIATWENGNGETCHCAKPALHNGMHTDTWGQNHYAALLEPVRSIAEITASAEEHVKLFNQHVKAANAGFKATAEALERAEAAVAATNARLDRVEAALAELTRPVTLAEAVEVAERIYTGNGWPA